MIGIMSFVMWCVCLIAMLMIGVALGTYRTRMRLLNMIGRMPNDVVGSRNAIIVRTVRLYILGKFEEGEKKCHW